MNWPFEHWHDGKVYLHNDNWKEFQKEIERNGYKGEKHDWLHNRISLKLHTPRNNIKDIPCPGDEECKYKIEHTTEWSMIYEPLPAFERTNSDPEGWLPSWHLYAEERSEGEKITILFTGNIWKSKESDNFLPISFNITKRNYFAYFQNQYWIMSNYIDHGTGANPPVKKSKKKAVARSIFDTFEESW